MDSSLFHVHQSAPVSGPVSAASVSVSASTSSIPAPLGHSLPGAGHVDAVDEDEVSLDSNASTADHHLQHHQSDPDPGAGSGAGPVAPWLANIKRRAPIACRRSVLPLLACIGLSLPLTTHLDASKPPPMYHQSPDSPPNTPPNTPPFKSPPESGPFFTFLGIPRQAVPDRRLSLLPCL